MENFTILSQLVHIFRITNQVMCLKCNTPPLVDDIYESIWKPPLKYKCNCDVIMILIIIIIKGQETGK